MVNMNSRKICHYVEAEEIGKVRVYHEEERARDSRIERFNRLYDNKRKLKQPCVFIVWFLFAVVWVRAYTRQHD